MRVSQLPLANHPQITVVDGGAERADSVLAGIQAAGTRSGCWCMTPRVRACIRTICAPAGAERNQQSGRHSGRPVRDTMKRAEPGKQAIAHTVERVDLWHALTPQFFPANYSTTA
jgi:2-C-methyl-D-erythritol 4-phosphate cytidylyltransferase